MAPPLTSLARVDLNLLTAFAALAEARHVTRAARTLGVSRPALSHSLRRLRDVFADALFVRAPGGMALTPLAESIAPAVRSALATLERDVFERRPFAPADLTRTFKIRTTDYLEAIVVPSVLATLAEQAPRVRLASVPVGPALPKAELESGACDLAIAGFFEAVPPGFHRQTLFEDTFACAVRKEHKLVRGRHGGLEAFCAERHIVVAPGGELTGGVDRALARRKLARRVVAGTSAFLVAAWICARTDHVLTAPLRLLEPLARPLGLETFEPPVAMPGIRIAQVWHTRSDADPAHRWFRTVLRDAAGRPEGRVRVDA